VKEHSDSSSFLSVLCGYRMKDAMAYSMFGTIRKLLELIRFSHTLFALPFALLAAVMAWEATRRDAQFYFFYAHAAKSMAEAAPFLGHPRGDALDPHARLNHRAADIPGRIAWLRWQELVGILFCMVFARSAAMAFNRLADRRLDAANPRTAARHLPRGELSVGAVTAFAVACSLAFIASTSFFLPNRLPLYLSVPVLLFLLGYSYAKRFTSLAHLWLGAALALSPVAVWIALRGEVVMTQPGDLWPAIVLAGAVLTWVAGFDIIYACQDVDFDRQAKLHSVPARFGVPAALRLAGVCHLLTIGFLAALPLVYPPFGGLYWAGVALVAVLLIYEHALVRPDDLNRVNIAFFNVNAVISFGLFAVGTLDLLVGAGG
jgi:4-hydroxybenzoate polyprenyltransferase